MEPQISFGDLTPYIIYDLVPSTRIIGENLGYWEKYSRAGSKTQPSSERLLVI
jgi:hypothetical protein